MEELIPGVSININTPVDPIQQQAQFNVAERLANEAEIKERRILSIKTKVGMRLSQGIPIVIDEEMKELGLEEEIRAMSLQADMHRKLMRHFGDDSDQELEGSNWLDD